MSDAISEFDAIYAQFRPKVLRYLKGLVGSNAAEDISQNVFVKVHAGLKDFRGEASLSTWIYRIATNAALDRLRNRSFSRSASLAADVGASDPSHESAVTNLASNACEPSAESWLMQRETNECITSFVDALPESYRTVLVLAGFDGVKNREIAAMLGLSLDTVKIRLHRARRELKKRFEAECYLYQTETHELACDMKSPTGRSIT